MKCELKPEDSGKKKGLWALLKESIAKSNDGCGPGCGCHEAFEKTNGDKVKKTENEKKK